MTFQFKTAASKTEQLKYYYLYELIMSTSKEMADIAIPKGFQPKAGSEYKVIIQRDFDIRVHT